MEATSHCAKKRATYVCLCVLTEGQEEAGRRAGGREATEGGARATEATAQEGGEGQCRVCGQ